MTPRPIEIELYKFFKPYKNKKFLLAVSGGADSMCLLYAFVELRKRWNLHFCVVHVHHGTGTNAQTQFRDRAYSFVKAECESLKVQFHSNITELSQVATVRDHTHSEAGFRELRKDVFTKIKKRTQADALVLAHHKEDLLETRLMRLIRGCGAHGIVAMKRKKGSVLRPFLVFERADLEQYIQSIKGHWVEDPSNSDVRYLRNWVRHSWLPLLEEKIPGSKAVLANSLHLLANSLQPEESMTRCFSSEGHILRPELLTLSLEDKKRVFAIYLKKQKVLNYGLSHVNELVKRLDVERKELTFKLAQKNWLANARHIWCED